MATEPKAKTILEVDVKWPLPCGCALTVGWVGSGPSFVSPDDLFKASRTALRQITDHLVAQAARHACSLVSPENPNGLPPIN